MELYEQLEVEFAKWAGISNVVACNSGTAALHLAFEALNLPPSSEVIVPDFSMIACARAVTLAGLTPVFVDCNSRLLLDPDLVDEAIIDETRAILAVHTYGRRADMDALADLATKHDLYLIEDSAEAHGIAPHPKTDVVAWSFYKNKIIAGEEGGAVSFRLDSLVKRAKKLRNQGFTCAHDFSHIPRGHNYRLANALADQILGSLRTVGGRLQARRVVEAYYDGACPNEWKAPKREVPWVYDIRIPDITNLAQNRIISELLSAGIAARHGFKPLSIQEEYRGHRTVTRGNAVKAAREVLYLPLAIPFSLEGYRPMAPQPGIPRTVEEARRIFQTIRSSFVL